MAKTPTYIELNPSLGGGGNTAAIEAEIAALTEEVGFNTEDVSTLFDDLANTDANVAQVVLDLANTDANVVNLAIGTWTAYTPTGTWVANCTYAGFYRIIGDVLEGQIKISVAGTPDNVSLDIAIPNIGYIIDYDKLFVTGVRAIGLADFYDSNPASTYSGETVLASTTTIGVRAFKADSTYVQRVAMNATVPIPWASGDELYVNFAVPIKVIPA